MSSHMHVSAMNAFLSLTDKLSASITRERMQGLSRPSTESVVLRRSDLEAASMFDI
jgi:hypothetical protein